MWFAGKACNSVSKWGAKGILENLKKADEAYKSAQENCTKLEGNSA